MHFAKDELLKFDLNDQKINCHNCYIKLIFQ